MDAVERFLAFSCVGRWTGAGEPPNTKKKEPRQKAATGRSAACSRTHELVVVDESGKEHPRFELAGPEAAQAHARAHAEKRNVA